MRASYNGAVSSLLLVASLLVTPAWASVCDDPLALEPAAFRGGLSVDEVACLDSRLPGLEPSLRAQVSFMLIVQEHMQGEDDRYGARMRVHLEQYHGRDTEVAYLYATWLRDQGRIDEELIRWATVALDGRFAWIDNKRLFNSMVQSLYDMINEAAIIEAGNAQKRLLSAPTEANRKRYEDARRRARYYMTISAPCLAKGECMPEFTVEVEGMAFCDDIFELADRARHGEVTADELVCLRSRYRKPTSNKRRILDVMIDNANQDGTGKQWQALLEFHHRVTNEVDPNLAAPYAEYLAGRGVASAKDALDWAAIAAQGEELRGGLDTTAALYALRVRVAEELLAWAKGVEAGDVESDAAAPSAEAAEQLLRDARTDRDEWCALHPRHCLR